jgi:malate/lactate dehydrogenase
MKVTIVGAGNVGATCADVIFYKCEKVEEGRKLDIMQCATIQDLIPEFQVLLMIIQNR